MGRISQYPLDTDIQGNDKWIGTSVLNANATKNFSVDKVIEYLNKIAGTDSQNLRYTYQNADNDAVRLSTTISFATPLGDNVPFSGITQWIISAFSKPIKDVRTYYDAPLIGSTILITHATNPSNWAIFRWNSVVEDIDNPDFYTVGLTHIDSAGGLEVNEDYLVALLDYGSASGGASWGGITGTLSDQIDLQSALDSKVPYTGAVANVDLGEFELKAGQVQFDQTPTGANGVGIMRWNDTDGTVDLLLKGGNVTLQVGQEQVTRVVNKSGADFLEANYQAVRINGAQGNRIRVALALADSDANSSETLGLVTETIANNQEGFVTSSGLVRNINTTGSLQSETWADGDTLYLSGTVSGTITNIKPSAPIHTVIIGYVVRAHATQGQIYVKVDNGYELGELHNVSVNGAVDKDILQYDGVTTLWESISLSGAGIQSTLVSGTNIKTINGVSLLGSGNLVVSASPSGVAGSVQFSDGSAFASDANSFFWNNSNKQLALNLAGFGSSATLHARSNGATSATYSLKAQNGTASKILTFDDAGQLGINITPTAILHSKGSGTTSATSSFKAENSTGAIYTIFRDDGVLLVTDGSNSSVVTKSYISAYDFRSNGGWGLSKLDLTGVMDLYSNDGTLGLRVDNTFVGITDSVSIGQITAPSSRLFIKGSGNTVATFSLKAENSDATSSFSISDSGISTFTFGTGGKVLIAAPVESGATLLEIRRTASSSGGFIFRSNNSVSQGLTTTNGVFQIETPDGSDIQLMPTTGNISLVTNIRTMTAINTGHQIVLGQKASSSLNRWVNYGWNTLYGSILQSAKDGGTPASDTLSLNPFGGNVGIGPILATATLHTKGSGTSSATQSFRAENNTNSRSILYTDNGELAFYRGATQSIGMFSSEAAIKFLSPSANFMSSGAVGIQYATGIPIVNGLFYAIGPNESHQFYKLIQLDGGISPNTIWTMTMNDGGATYANTYEMLKVVPTLILSGSGVKNVVGYTFSPSITNFNGGGKLYGAVFENGGLLIGGIASSGNSSASLEIISTTKGALLPRMTTAQKNAITTPAIGLLVYDTDLLAFYQYNGTAWTVVGGGGSGSPAGSVNSIQFNDAGSFGGATNLTVDNGDLTILKDPTPTAPSANNLKIFAEDFSGRMMPAVILPDGFDYPLQAQLGHNKVAYWAGIAGATTNTGTGIALQATGTATSATWAATSLHTSMNRLAFAVATAAATAVGGFRGGSQNFWRGNAAGLGGFTYISRFSTGIYALTAANRCFVGLRASTTAPTDVAPSGLLDILGCGWDSSDTTLQIYAAGSANSKINTGITVNRTANNSQVFELAMFASPNGSDVTIQVTDLSTGTVFSTVISTVANLPSNTTALNVYGYNSAGGTSSSISIELMSLYVETNY